MSTANTYHYYINLHERGEFYADVRDPSGSTVWELHTEQAQELCEDGFLNNVCDPQEISEYLQDMGIIPRFSTMIRM